MGNCGDSWLDGWVWGFWGFGSLRHVVDAKKATQRNNTSEERSRQPKMIIMFLHHRAIAELADEVKNQMSLN